MAADREKAKKVAFILGDPDLYPDEFKAWLPRAIEQNPNLRLSQLQLPQVETIRYIGSSGQPAFQGTWVNYGGGFEEAGYWKDPWGLVHLCGLVKLGTINTPVFTLPGGYRPKAREIFAADTSANAHGRCDISAAGDVIPVAGNNAYFSLSGITFRAFG